MEILEGSLEYEQLPKGCKWYVADYAWGERREACVRVPPTDTEAECFQTEPDIDGDNSERLATCRLQYETSFYPELDYDHDFKIRILNDLIDFGYMKNDYNRGVQAAASQLPEVIPNHLLRSTEHQRKCDGRPQEA